ncbi:MAG: alpha/beta hydrolase [Caldilineaceae bacterium]
MSNPIIARHVQTARLNTYIRESGPADGMPVVLVHGNVSSSLFYESILAGAPSTYRVIAPDLRGYGDSEVKPVDATRGVRDWSDDLYSLLSKLEISGPVALAGWSLGGGVAMQFALDHPQLVSKLILISPVSPYGFGATKGLDGTLVTPDAAGSGGGTANADFVNLLAANDTGSASQVSPRNVMNAFYFKPPFRVAPELENRLVAAMNQTAVGNDNYPGTQRASANWPMIAPGSSGVLNTLAPTYFNVSALVNLNPKPPVLWVRGADDQIVADSSFFDLAFLGQLGAVPGWPGPAASPPQPMVSQTRAVLERYQAKGGTYKEVVFANCGHSPHIEKKREFQETLWAFVNE